MKRDFNKFINGYASKSKDERDKYYDEVIKPNLMNVDSGELLKILKVMNNEARTLKENYAIVDIMNYINLAYISEVYFKKSKSWLYHRIKKSVVNGKPIDFKEDELEKFQEALNHISIKLSTLSKFLDTYNQNKIFA
jgi:hypothetical protein